MGAKKEQHYNGKSTNETNNGCKEKSCTMHHLHETNNGAKEKSLISVAKVKMKQIMGAKKIAAFCQKSLILLETSLKRLASRYTIDLQLYIYIYIYMSRKVVYALNDVKIFF